jgi:DNA polymerase-4
MRYIPADGLKYLFIDFNAFFAAVEQHDNPALLGRPVIVTPLKSEYTSAIAVSYEARPFGIRRGTKVRDARALCPGIAVCSARHDRYVQVHHQLMREVERHLPLSKIYSIDEAVFCLNPSEAKAEPALMIAHAVMDGIRQNVGPALRASIGLAQTRLLAKLAAEMHKPDGFTVIEPNDLPDKFIDMDLSDIPGIGKGMAMRLARNGITDFSALWALQPKHARRIWNSVQGERFCYSLHGFEVDEPNTVKSMIGHSRVLARGYETPDKARLVARALLLKAASRLRNYGFHATRMTLGVRIRLESGGRIKWDQGTAFAATQDSFAFLLALDRLWACFLDNHCRKGSKVRLGSVTVYLHGLAGDMDAAVTQGDLFADPVEEQVSTRRKKLWGLIDKINSDPDGRFARLSSVASRPQTSENTTKRYVTIACQQGMDLNYLGAKIAFSRVPEENEFLF